MLKSTSKAGRPKAIFKPKTGGDPIVGLMRLKDGRWRVSGPGKITFTEPDEKFAIARFREIEARRNGQTRIDLPIGKADAHETSPLIRKAIKGRMVINIPRHPSAPVEIRRSLDCDEVWAFFREQILTRPKYVAERVGIEQLGYLRNLKEPVPPPPLDVLEQTWKEHFTSSAEQKRKCFAAFEDFRLVTGIPDIEAISPEIVVKYRDVVYGRKLSGKSQSNLFTRVRRYLSFFRDRAIAMDAINKALGYLALLTPSESTVTLDPKPVDPADWKKLLATAKGDDKPMVLLMLNCAMYLQEVIKLKWSEIQGGCLVTHRSKTGKCVRVATLWPETLEALKSVERKGTSIFLNYAGAPLGIKGAEKRFRELRDAAKTSVTSSQLRDGAYTAAVEANVSSNLCQLLVGHRCGMPDHYVKRKPSMVAPACEAIYRAYFGDAPK
jgi:integrase